MSDHRGLVVAGVSRARPAVNEHVIRWAADAARVRGLHLHVIHAQEWPRSIPQDTEPGDPAHAWATQFRAGGQALLEEARQAAWARQPALTVSTELAVGRPVHVLREAGEKAAMLVLGAHRYNFVESALSGSDKGHALIGHLPCTLALVPEPPDDAAPSGPVVVGVDGSPSSLAAVELAFAEADAAGVPLVAIEVCRPGDAAWPSYLAETPPHLAELLAGHRARYPDLDVRQDMLTGQPAVTLASASRGARCLVVGSRGRGGFRGMLLGSTSRALVNHTGCPLLVTPGARPS